MCVVIFGNVYIYISYGMFWVYRIIVIVSCYILDLGFIEKWVKRGILVGWGLRVVFFLDWVCENGEVFFFINEYSFLVYKLERIFFF